MKNLIKIFVVLVIVLSSETMFAADFVIEKFLPGTSDLRVGDEVLLNATLVSDGVEYNAIEGVVTIPPVFVIDRVITGNSFVSVWLENPADFSVDTIRFSGITPAGYNQERGTVFSIVLRAVTPGSGIVGLADIGIYKNDGLGTREDIRASRPTFGIREIRKDELPYLIAVKDTTPPLAFSAEIVSDHDLFDGEYVLVWNTRDLGSGIVSYDVIERNRVFKQVNSPYLLENQRLNGKIKVVAYDHEGNNQVTEIIPPGKVCVGVDCFSPVKLAVIFAIVVFVLIILWRKSRK